MFNPHREALDRLFSKFDEDEDERMKKLSPKAEMSVEVVKPSDEKSDISPEMIAKLLEVLKGEAGSDDEEEHLANGGIAGRAGAAMRAFAGLDDEKEESPEEPVKASNGGKAEHKGRFTCGGCGKDIASCRCDKMADGGLVDDDSLHGEQMRRREDQRVADADANTADDMAELSGSKVDHGSKWKKRELRKSRYYGKD